MRCRLEQGTWAPGRGVDFAVRSSTYLENGVKKPSAEPLYTVGVAGFAMSAGAVNDGSRAYPEVLEKLIERHKQVNAHLKANKHKQVAISLCSLTTLRTPGIGPCTRARIY